MTTDVADAVAELPPLDIRVDPAAERCGDLLTALVGLLVGMDDRATQPATASQRTGREGVESEN